MTPKHDDPVPNGMWKALCTLFGPQRLARLLGISASNVHRYANSQRTTPDPVAARLRWLAGVVKQLSGSYNEQGIRSWFTRPRQALDGQSPQSLLDGAEDWSPDTDAARRIKTLAKAGTGMTVT